jgi:hypothetical protein
MLLLPAVALGFLAGVGGANLRRQAYKPPELQAMWLVFLAYLPQAAMLYLPALREKITNEWTGILLTVSQFILLGFGWLNCKLPGMLVLLIGAALNFTVMTANRGFMPISPETASRLIPQEILEDIPAGNRFGLKDILLPPEQTRFEILADRFLPPAWFPYQAAFSLGDVFIAFGVFWLLASQNQIALNPEKRIPI